MPWRNVKLVAFDLDGTVLQDERVPRDACRLLKQFVDCGGVVTTATGRGPAVQEEILRRSRIGPGKGYPHFLIAYDKFIYRLRGTTYEPMAAWNDGLMARWRSVLPVIVERLPEVNGAFEAQEIAWETVGHDEYWEEAGFLPMVFDDRGRALAAAEIMEGILRDIQGVYINRNGRTAAATCTGFDKGEALRHLAQTAAVKPDETLAVGDAFNDLSMLDGRFGFHSASVANAEPEIKDAVGGNNGYISPQCASEGFCDVMRKLLAQIRGK